MSFKVVVDMQPFQTVVEVSMKLGHETVGLVQKSKGNVNGPRQVIETPRER